MTWDDPEATLSRLRDEGEDVVLPDEADLSTDESEYMTGNDVSAGLSLKDKDISGQDPDALLADVEKIGELLGANPKIARNIAHTEQRTMASTGKGSDRLNTYKQIALSTQGNPDDLLAAADELEQRDPLARDKLFGAILAIVAPVIAGAALKGKKGAMIGAGRLIS